KTPGWKYPSALWVREARRLVDLDGRLPAFLKGDDKPGNAAEQLELAKLCAMKGWYTTSARFFTEAFAARAALAEDTEAGNRYDAACAAALAGCGQGKDPNRPDDAERVRLRRQALDWLKADLE